MKKTYHVQVRCKNKRYDSGWEQYGDTRFSQTNDLRSLKSNVTFLRKEFGKTHLYRIVTETVIF